jgi:alpha-tubulin suppressor-like RCC1 family protein
LAIDTDGVLWVWGNNASGQIGNGIAKNQHVPPFQIVFEEKVVDIDGGFEFSMALCEDGTVWAWGDNKCGQLGIGSFESKSTPTKVILPQK